MIMGSGCLIRAVAEMLMYSRRLFDNVPESRRASLLSNASLYPGERQKRCVINESSFESTLRVGRIFVAPPGMIRKMIACVDNELLVFMMRNRGISV